MSLRRYWLGIAGQVIAGLKRFTRDKVSLFFTFAFPLIFLFVFGSIFSNASVSFNIAIVNYSKSEFAQRFIDEVKSDSHKLLKVEDVNGIDEARQKMKRSEIDGIIELPEDFGVVSSDAEAAAPSGVLKVLYAKGSDQAGSALTAVMEQIISFVNKELGQPESPFKVEPQAVGDEQLSNFDYTFTGLLAFSLMSMGVFVLASQMPAEKQKGSYRRLRAAPFTAGQLVIATSIIYTLISITSAVMVMIVGALVFKFQMRGDWLLFVPFLVLSAVMMVGIGLAIGAWAKNENQASPLSNLVAFPMMFLSGTFFPAYLFPEWLSNISRFIPMTSIVDGFRLIMTESASLSEVLPQFGGVLISIVVVYTLAIKLFHWE